jgi:hypothetical protein
MRSYSNEVPGTNTIQGLEEKIEEHSKTIKYLKYRATVQGILLFLIVLSDIFKHYGF